MTDNRNRTVGELRHMLAKYGGNLGEANSVAWMFEKKGGHRHRQGQDGRRRADDRVLDAGADDLSDEGENWEVISPPSAARNRAGSGEEARRSSPPSAQVAMVPKNYVKLEGKPAQQMMKLMDALDDHDDVQHVWSNFDIEEKEIEASLA